MGFFDEVLEHEEEPEPEEVEFPPTPEWLAAPEGYVAGVVPEQIVLARNQDAAVFLTRFAAYHCGFSFEAHLFTRRDHVSGGFDVQSRMGRRDRTPPDDLLRLGVEFADGRRAACAGSMIDGSMFAAFGLSDDEGPDPETDLSFTTHGGGGTPKHTCTEYWVWPLPPEGPLKLVCEWPVYEIPETATTIDAAVIREASARSAPIWNT